MPPFTTALAGFGSSGGGGGGAGMSNPIHFQAPAVAVPRSTVVSDEKGREVVLHTVRVRFALDKRAWVGRRRQKADTTSIPPG